MQPGPRLLATIAVTIAIMCLMIVLVVEPGQAAAATVVRWTARTSLLLFSAAYVARPLVQLWPHPAAKWLLKYRKWLGLGFAISHLAHLEGIVALAAANATAFWASRGPADLVPLLVYAGIGALAVTSSEALKKQMSPARWKHLHLAGIHVVWVTFFVTYVGSLADSAGYVVPLLIVLGVGGVRLAAALRKRGIIFASRSPARPA